MLWRIVENAILRHGIGIIGAGDDIFERFAFPFCASDQFITIEADGNFRWGKDPVSQKDLENKLDEVAAKDGEQPTIHIRGDRSLPYQKIMDVVNMLKSRDLSKLSLDTKAG